jgi:hypothetical protein
VQRPCFSCWSRSVFFLCVLFHLQSPFLFSLSHLTH